MEYSAQQLDALALLFTAVKVSLYTGILPWAKYWTFSLAALGIEHPYTLLFCILFPSGLVFLCDLLYRKLAF